MHLNEMSLSLSFFFFSLLLLLLLLPSILHAILDSVPSGKTERRDVCDTDVNKSKYSLRHDLFIALCKPANSSGKLFRSISQRRLESNESHLWKSSLMKCSLKLFFFFYIFFSDEERMNPG